MAALIEGQQYGLSAQDKNNSTKTIIFVKLTDSALRSIEEYVKNKGSADSKATIQFQNSNGVLSLPQNGINQIYGFSLSNVEADGPQGSFECLRQTGHRSLESLGCMHMKMHIHANEDSYENTRVKMAAVEKEKNKSCTKVIKVAGAHLGRKVKVKRPGLVVNPPKPLNSPPSASLINKNPLKMTNGITNGISSNIPSKKLPEVNKYHKPVPVKNKPTISPELLRQPIRDRIIHILAVRPYRRPELMCRLNTEGVKEKDKKGITAILTQVGVLKKNVYNLANYCWNEVQDNWKFATQEELEIIRRRKQQRFSANAANESPPLNTYMSSSPTPAEKRIAPDSLLVGGQEPRGKKQRISHYNRTSNSNMTVKHESSDSNDKIHVTSTGMTRKPTYSPIMSEIDPEGEASPKSPNNSCDSSPKKPRLSHYNRADNFNHNNNKDTSDSSEKLPFTSSTTSKVTSFSPVQSNNGIPMDIESSPKSPDNSCDGFSNLPHKNSNSNHSDDALSSSSLRNASREDGEKSIRKHTTGLSQQENRSYERSFHKGHQPVKRHEPDESNVKHSSSHSKSSVNSDNSKSSFQNQTLSHARLTDSQYDPKAQVSPDSNTQYQAKDVKIDSCSKSVVNGYVNNSIKSNGYSNQSSYMNRSKVTSTTNGSCSTSPHSPESYSDSNDSMGNSPGIMHLNLPPSAPDSYSEVPDYVSKYVRIRSPEQRSKYKQDFNAQYDEYLSLHSKIEKIKAKFTLLNHSLRNYDEGSEEFRKISSKIVKAYRAYHEDENYKKSEEKLLYLHNKLSHIKKLVMEYDNEYFARS